MGKLHRRYRNRKHKKNPSSGSSPRHNPPLITDLAEFIGPGFAAFAITRFGTRIAATQIAKRKPAWGKHAGALASVGAFLAAWLLAHRVKFLAKYHTPIAVGAGIAAAQSIIQLYIPKLGWMVSDASPEIAAAAAAPAQIPAGSPSGMGRLPSDLEYVDEDPAMYTYNDSYDAGIHTTKAQEKAQAQQTNVDEMMDIDLDEGETQGIFGGG